MKLKLPLIALLFSLCACWALPAYAQTTEIVSDFSTDPFIEGWQQFNIEGSAEAWEWNGSFSNLQMSGFTGDGCEASEDWLVTPRFDFDANANETLEASLRGAFLGNGLTLLYSSTWDGVSEPTIGDWTTVFTVPAPAGSEEEDVNLEITDEIRALSGQGYLAFLYEVGAGDCSRWRFDDISLTGDGSGGGGGPELGIVYEEDFSDCDFINTWQIVDLEGGDGWFCTDDDDFDLNTTFSGVSGDKAVAINGFNSSDADETGGEEDWLVSPAIDLSAASSLAIAFDQYSHFRGGGQKLQLFFSQTYDGSGTIDLADWTEVDNTNFFESNAAEVDRQWGATPSTPIMLDAGLPTNAVRFAFLHEIAEDASFPHFAIDNFRILGDISNVARISVNGSLSGFGAVSSGSVSSEQSYQITGANLTSGITVTAPAFFEISKSTGADFGSILTYTAEELNGNVQEIFVRFVPTAGEDGPLSGDIVHASDGVEFDAVSVNVSGLQFDPTVITPIADLRPNDEGGLPTRLGELVTIEGIAVGPDSRAGTSGFQFVVIDGSDAGIVVRATQDAFDDAPFEEGDVVRLVGEVGAFRGVTQLSVADLDEGLDEAVRTDSGAPRPDARVVTTIDESTESSLVTLENVSLNAAQWEGEPGYTGGGFNVTLTLESGETVTMRVEDGTELAENFFEEVFFSSGSAEGVTITGIGGQFAFDAPFDDGYQIAPYLSSDIEAAVPTVPTLLSTTSEIEDFGSVPENTATSSVAYRIIGFNLTEDVTVSASENFQVSADGSSFGSSAVYSAEEVNNGATVFARFLPGDNLNGLQLRGEITHSTEGVNDVVVFVSGGVGNPPAIVYEENFNGCDFLDEWEVVDTDGTSNAWGCSTDDSNSYPGADGGTEGDDAAFVNGFVSSNDENSDDWLVSPAIDLSGVATPFINFAQYNHFDGGGQQIQVFVSQTYSGSGTINLSEWSEVDNSNFLTSNSEETDRIWGVNENIPITLDDGQSKSNVRFAFVYKIDFDPAGSAASTFPHFAIDNFRVTESVVEQPVELIVGFADAALNVSEADGQIEVGLTLSAPAPAEQLITIGVGAGSQMTPNEDFTTSPSIVGDSFTLTVPAGSTAASFTVDLDNDGDAEGLESLVFTIERIQGGAVRGVPGSINIAVQDDDVLILSETAIDFGTTAGGNGVDRTYTVTANGVSGNLNITAPEPFLVSVDNGTTFANSVSVDASNSPFSVTLRFIPSISELNQNFTAQITHSASGNAVSLTATGASSSTTGLGDLEEAGLSIYPNPASSRLYIKFVKGFFDRPAKMEMMSVTGQSMLRSSLQGNGYIDVSNLSAGMYLLKVTIEGNTYAQRIVIRK